MTEHVPAAAEGLPISNADPAVEIGMELVASMKRDDRLQVGSYDARHNKRWDVFDEAANHEQDHSYALRDLLTSVKATTLTGAAMQLCEVVSRVDILRDQFPEEAADYRIKRDFRAVMRLLFSVLDVIEGSINPRLSEIDPTYFGGNISPWADPFEKARDDERCGAEKGGAK